MAEINVVVRRSNATARVNELGIIARRSRFSKTIVIPFALQFGKLSEMHNYERETKAVLFNIDAKLSVLPDDEQISFTTFQFNREVFKESPNTCPLEFELDNWKLERTEQYRKRDIDFKLRFTLNLAFYSRIEGTGNYSFPNSFEPHGGELTFKVPQSHWVNEILNKIYKPFSLIEIPRSPLEQVREHRTALAEIEKAQSYLQLGDYDKAVAHARTALEPIRKKFQGLQNWLKATKGMDDWKNNLRYSTLQWLDDVFRIQADITNTSHHSDPLSFGNFTRRDAEAILLVTIAIISVGGKVDEVDNRSII
jgi:hypothetical protein